MTTLDDTQATETKQLRNFKSSADIENFYRFVHENKLRREAQMIMDAVMQVLKPKKKSRKGRKRKTKLQ